MALTYERVRLSDSNLIEIDIVTDDDGRKSILITPTATSGGVSSVDVLSLPPLPAGTNNIGDVDIASALPAGDNNIGNVDIVTLPALPAGTNNIGDVDVLSLPALPAGNNNIGDVDIASMPALPTGANVIGKAKITNGTNDLDIVDLGQANQKSALIAPGFLSVSASTTTAQAIGTTDAANFVWVSVHIVTQGTSSTVTFQISNDNTNWRSCALEDSANGNIAAQNSSAGIGIFHGPLSGRYFRLNVTGISAGTTSVVVVFYTAAHALQTLGVSSNITMINGNTPGAADGKGPSANLGITSQVFYGAATEMLRTPAVFIPVALGAATAETTIWTPTSGKKFRLMGFLLTCGAASTLTFKDGTGGTTIFAARGGIDVPITSPPMGNGKLSAAANNVLTVTRGTSCTLDGFVFGTEE